MDKTYLRYCFETLSFLLLIALISGCNSTVKKPDISVDEMKRIVKTLSSDEFMGRMPFTEGEKVTVKFLADELKNAGFEPPFEGSYFQKVPMIKITSKVVDNTVIINVKGEKMPLSAPDEIAINSLVPEEKIELTNARLVFCGFGINDSKLSWDDYAGVDMKGKIAVVLINDPGFYTNDSTLFRGREMTIYGRWTYKYEQAAREGAAGVLIIHESTGAGYDYNVPRNSSISGHLSIDCEDKTPVCQVNGWLPEKSAVKILEKLGYNLQELRAASCVKGFKPFELDANMTISIKNQVEKNNSVNVAGILKGTDKSNESVVISAHWDHFGIGEPQDGDSIFNGAVDNGTAIAWALETGRACVKATPRPVRSLIILFPTAEEQGLVGSDYYAGHPATTGKIMACINNDLMLPRGKMKDVTMIGYGYSTLDSLYAEAAAIQGRYLFPDPESHTGLFFRSDHFSFFKRGIPSIWARGCYDSREKGKDKAKEEWQNYIKNVYHRPADNYNENWDWSGLVEDTELTYYVVQNLIRTNKIRPRNL